MPPLIMSPNSTQLPCVSNVAPRLLFTPRLRLKVTIGKTKGGREIVFAVFVLILLWGMQFADIKVR
jgi:hypothetical protein